LALQILKVPFMGLLNLSSDKRESDGQQRDQPPRRSRAPTNSSERGFGAAQGKESAAPACRQAGTTRNSPWRYKFLKVFPKEGF
jgi:hypothetical protein